MTEAPQHAMTAARLRAEHAQARAADPTASAWVEASAGSGKTKLLTDRVLRLLLAGVEPGRILCLTFTKAAAAEMATRLARALGAWATSDDTTLGRELTKLTARVPDDAERLTARRLFVRVLEQPGGMRISTIHAFAQSLLRAFPLEAGLAPQFGVVEDRQSRALLARERDAVLAAAPDRAALEALARLVPPSRFADLVGTLAQARSRLLRAVDDRHGLVGLRGALARRLGLDPDTTSEDAVREAGCEIDAAPLNAAAAALKASRNTNDRERGEAIADWIKRDVAGRAARWGTWSDLLLTMAGVPRARFATDGAGAAKQSIQDCLFAEAQRVVAVEATLAAARLFAATVALLAIGMPVLRGYDAAKHRAGMLDYDDLIAGAERLLQDPGSAWVLFKLDGGLDHVLLDEAQDSNPDQWGIVRALSGEFFSGEGAREAGRTIFAVGDKKQSIYAFQGADSEGFVREAGHYQAAVRAAGLEFRAVPLDVSFRSTEPVLALVDAVFAAGAARDGVVAPEDTLRHYADRAGQAGSVELWPLLRAAATPPPPPWAPPEAPVDGQGAAARLAEALAARIQHMVDHEILPARIDASSVAPRRVRAGDILVLVRSRRRGGFVPALVRALKGRGIAVGGVDRMVLVEQLPVMDLLALADTLLLPEDDLALAALLKSPLVGLTEEELFDLAHQRPARLWAALVAHRGSEQRLGRAADWIAGLMAKADFCTPHSLFAEVLGAAGPLDPRSGRARILARLGPDAADPLDEFLNAALEHERGEPPSLQGFVHAQRQGAAEVKREGEGTGDAVRIMTVHGAKGLQAPIVILPDTTGAPPEKPTLRWLDDPGGALPVWAPRLKGFTAPVLATQRGNDREAEAREQHRLLYVALTRAEDRLLVCGWQSSKDLPPDCWYRLVEAAFHRVEGAVTDAFDPDSFGAQRTGFADESVLLRRASEQTAEARAEAMPRQTTSDALPTWARSPAKPETHADGIAPSALRGEDETPSAPPGGAGDPLGRRFRRGQLVHALLQHLPQHPPEDWAGMAGRFLDRRGQALTPAQRDETLEEVLALLRETTLAEALGPDSLAEAPLAGRIGGRTITGQVDRLLIRSDRVLVLDYKTNRPPPEGLDAVPGSYLRQMAAYRAILGAAFPGRTVECALIWTYGARFMRLPDELLDRHAPSAA